MSRGPMKTCTFPSPLSWSMLVKRIVTLQHKYKHLNRRHMRMKRQTRNAETLQQPKDNCQKWTCLFLCLTVFSAHIRRWSRQSNTSQLCHRLVSISDLWKKLLCRSFSLWISTFRHRGKVTVNDGLVGVRVIHLDRWRSPMKAMQVIDKVHAMSSIGINHWRLVGLLRFERSNGNNNIARRIGEETDGNQSMLEHLFRPCQSYRMLMLTNSLVSVMPLRKVSPRERNCFDPSINQRITARTRRRSGRKTVPLNTNSVLIVRRHFSIEHISFSVKIWVNSKHSHVYPVVPVQPVRFFRRSLRSKTRINCSRQTRPRQSHSIRRANTSQRWIDTKHRGIMICYSPSTVRIQRTL